MSRSDYNVFLDLDETLISSQDYSKKAEYKDLIPKYNTYEMDTSFVVFERPGLQEFLDYLFDNYNVSVWTAANKSYAVSIIENCILKKDKPKRRLDWIFWSYHCNIAFEKYGHQKCLNMLWKDFKHINTGFGYQYNTKNTVIIDDNPDVYEAQRDMCIRINKFDPINKSDDTELLKITNELESRWTRTICGTEFDIDITPSTLEL